MHCVQLVFPLDQKLMITARRPRQVNHSFIHQWHIKLETVLICEYVIGIRSVQCRCDKPAAAPLLPATTRFHACVIEFRGESES